MNIIKLNVKSELSSSNEFDYLIIFLSVINFFLEIKKTNSMLN